jgi:hypothetical protein
MTATPRLYTPRVRHEAGQLDVEVASMDDETVFGPVLHRLSFGEAIERDLLSDYQVVVVGVDDETYRTYAERGEFVTRDGDRITDARTLAGQIGLAKSMTKYDLRRTVSFHNLVPAARKFSGEMPDVVSWMPPGARPAGQLWSEHVSGRMTSGHRDRLLLRFRDLAPTERGLLSNARCLGEGVDVPSIDGVAFIDPRRSTIDIVQALGRAIRKSPDKKVGTIVLPVFVSDDEDPEQVLDQSAFKHIWDVLKALRAHDEALGEELDELRRRLGARRSAPQRPGKIKLDVPVGRAGAPFVRAFNARLVQRTTASWEFWYGLLQRFAEREGHSRIPIDYRDDMGYQLGPWVSNQRALRGRGHLSEDRTRRLAAIPGWVWDEREAVWEDGYAHLMEFAKREGHGRVPQAYRTDDGHNLGAWVSHQRALRRRGQLSEEKLRRLEAFPGWIWDPREAEWEDGFARLQQFAEREGHSRVPLEYRENDGYHLGRWVANQRARRKGPGSEDRRRRLEAVPGWAWKETQARWEEGYGRLLAFVEREGHSRVPAAYRDNDGYPLGNWVLNRRNLKRRGQLSEERAELLAALPGWAWDTQEAAWEEGYARLKAFAEREGHTWVLATYLDDGFRLGSWVQVNRQAYRRGKLSEERIRELEALPGWAWVQREANWEDGYARLLRFAQREGHVRVPRAGRDKDGFRLGPWVDRQRQRRKRGQLSKEQQRRLEALPGWAWRPSG